MAEFIEVMKQKKRMCETLNCRSCSLSSDNNNCNVGCTKFILKYYEQSEKIIMNWAKEHPAKTNADKFKEVFGVEINASGGIVSSCTGIKCPDSSCDNCKYKDFWQQEYKEPKGE